MSLQVTGKAQVYKMEDKGKFATGTLRTSKKNQQTQEWESEFFNAKFVGAAGNVAKNLADKTKIELTKAILENREYQGKHYLSVVVFEFVTADGEQLAPQNEGFYPIDEDPSDLPF